MATYKELRQALDYDPGTGVFTWRHRLDVPRRVNSRRCGKKAGGPHPEGYISIGLGGKKYLAHRLAWLYVYGEWPEQFIDHINLDRSDNRISNLRQIDPLNNSANISTRKNSNSGYRGVWFRKDRQRWVAQIHRDRKCIWLGSFKTIEDAAAAYARAAEVVYGEYCPEHLKEGCL